MKYFIKNLNLPDDIINYIYGYLDNYYFIKNNNILFKRLKNSDFEYYMHNKYLLKLALKREERILNILINQKAYGIIYNIHLHNIKMLP